MASLIPALKAEAITLLMRGEFQQKASSDKLIGIFKSFTKLIRDNGGETFAILPGRYNAPSSRFASSGEVVFHAGWFRQVGQPHSYVAVIWYQNEQKCLFTYDFDPDWPSDWLTAYLDRIANTILISEGSPPPRTTHQ